MPYLDLILLHLLLVICCYTDCKSRKIYNSVTLSLTVIGIANLYFLYPLKEAIFQSVLLIPILLFSFLLFKMHQIGGGDAKMIIAIFSIMGFGYSVVLIFVGFIISWFYIFTIYLSTKLNEKKENITVPMGSMMFIALIILDIIYWIK